MKTSVFTTLLNTRLNSLKTVNEQEIMAIIKDLIKPIDYVPYEKKIALVESVIKSTENEHYRTPMRYRELIIVLINAYTSLEIDRDDFDTLSSNKLLDPIVSTFKSEYVICESLMKMMMDDILMADGR